MVTLLSLGLDEALKAIAAVTAELKKRKLAATVAVADANGELIVLHRLDGSPLGTINIAMNKAWTAARERKNEQIDRAGLRGIRRRGSISRISATGAISAGAVGCRWLWTGKWWGRWR